MEEEELKKKKSDKTLPEFCEQPNHGTENTLAPLVFSQPVNSNAKFLMVTELSQTWYLSEETRSDFAKKHNCVHLKNLHGKPWFLLNSRLFIGEGRGFLDENF